MNLLFPSSVHDMPTIFYVFIKQRNLFCQVAAMTLMVVCQRIGPELTALHVLPQLKELFDELAFSQETGNVSGSFGRNLRISKAKVDGEAQIESRMDLVWVLYSLWPFKKPNLAWDCSHNCIGVSDCHHILLLLLSFFSF